MNNFWKSWNDAAVGETITVQSANWYRPARTVTKIAGLEQNYVDDYIQITRDNGNTLGEKLKEAFSDVVDKINLQSKYIPTLISHVGEDASGFISFVDKIGPYMAVTDVKGILINNRLYSGADLASNFVAGGGNLGTYDEPTELGHEMVAAIRHRLGLSSDDEARTLIGLAYDNGQIYYNSDTDFSNYIGWYADEAGKFLGFYQDGVTQIADTNAVYTIKSYGYLGVEHNSDMMYAIVQVRHNIKTGEETVALAVPAALIPVMTYEVSLDGSGNLDNLQVSGSQSPIRLVYEVALDSHINQWNMKEMVSSQYLAENTNSDGTVNFYTNDWEHSKLTGYNTVNTYSYFNPSRQNSKYYYTEDASVYTNTSGTLYEGSSAPAKNGTFYRAYTVYEKNGSTLNKRTAYRRLSEAALETAVSTEGTNNWHIPNGNIHVNMDGYTFLKESNETGTLSVSSQAFVDTNNHSVGDEGYNFYVGATLGNNGLLKLKSETGIKIHKALAENATPTDSDFAFVLEKDPASASTHAGLLVNVDGTEADTTVSFDSEGMATVKLKAGQTVYIGGLTAGERITVTETETAEYLAEVSVNGQTASNPATVTVTANTFAAVDFVNADRGTGNLTVAKEIEHPFGTAYQVPEALADFVVTVTLSGIGTKNKTFAASHINGSLSSVTTDANGQFTVSLADKEQFTVYGLPAGTTAKVVETTYGTGFTPSYWNNGVQSNQTFGQVAITRGDTVSVIVENTYEPQTVHPVNIELGGQKIVKRADGSTIDNWDDDYKFTVVLQKFDKDANAWQPVDSKQLDKDTKSFTFNMSGEVYSKPGVYAYQVFEVEPAIDSTERVEGIVYDTVNHIFSVYVSDANMDGKLEIARVVSEHDNEDVELIDGKYTVTTDFVNVQTTEIPAQVAIDIQKVLINNTGSNRVNLAGYSFELYTDAACTVAATDINNVLEIKRNHTDAAGEGRIDVIFHQTTAANAPHVFYLKEVNTAINGMNHDPKVIKVEITVNNHATVTGALTAEVAYFDVQGVPLPQTAFTDDNELIFTNEYTVQGTQLPIDFVSKVLSGRDMKANEFVFEVKDGNGHVVATGKNAAANDGQTAGVVFDKALSFDKAGVYFFDVVEASASGNGVTTDHSIYRVMVTVTDVNGTLSATYTVLNVVGNNIVFRNTYATADTTYAISGTKNLSGRVLLNDEFTFVLTEAQNANGDVISGAKTYEAYNELAGRFTFPEISYTQPGTYYYVVTEKQNTGSTYGITYDTAKHVVTVTVKDNGLGSLTASADLDASDIRFNNRYTAASTIKSIDGEKVLHGKTLVVGQFSFELWQSNSQWAEVGSNPIQTVKNDAQGNFAFSFVDYTNGNASEFTKEGTYYYIIKEVNGGQTIDGVTYDGTVYRVRVDITDDLLGQLHATANIFDGANVPQESILFENEYRIAGSSSLEIGGNKTLNGAVPNGYTFEFELYEANAQYETIGNYMQKVTQNASGQFVFELNYTPEDISDTPYYYVVKETNGGAKIDGVSYDNTVYHIEVKVVDDDKGGVKSTATLRKDGQTVQSLDFANTYEAAATKVVLGGEKKLSGNRKLKANDFTFEVFRANERFESIASAADPVKNDANGKFTFAEIALETAGDHHFIVSENRNNPIKGVTYDTSLYHVTVKVTDDGAGQLEVESITYTRVKGESAQQANGILFENVYKGSNPDSPKTGDDSNPYLWFALLLVSGAGIVILAVTEKKKKLAKK